MTNPFIPRSAGTQTSDRDKADALHALGVFYLRQGFAEQGLSLLVAACRIAPASTEIKRALACAYLAAEKPQRTLKLCDLVKSNLATEMLRDGNEYLRSKALLKLGRLGEAQDAYSRAMQSEGERISRDQTGKVK